MSDAESIAAWMDFLREYAKGIKADGAAMPPLTEELLQLRQRAKGSPLAEEKVINTAIYTSSHVDEATARRVRQFYCENLYLPPP